MRLNDLVQDVAVPTSPINQISKDSVYGYVVIGIIAVVFVVIAIIYMANKDD